jgi:hypothetical protein
MKYMTAYCVFAASIPDPSNSFWYSFLFTPAVWAIAALCALNHIEDILTERKTTDQ